VALNWIAPPPRAAAYGMTKVFDGPLRAAPPGPAAVTVVKNSCAFGSVPKNVCWSTVITVVVDAGFPSAEVLYGVAVEVSAPACQTSSVYPLIFGLPSDNVEKWSTDENRTDRPPLTEGLALLTVRVTSSETFAFPAKSRATAVSL
jgi:hypothetical protein